MNQEPTNKSPDKPQTTGRYIITFKKDAMQDGLQMLSTQFGVAGISRSTDAKENDNDNDQADNRDVYFEKLGMAVVSIAPQQAARLSDLDGESPILSIEPEIVMHANQDLTVDSNYIKGWRDAYDILLGQFADGTETETIQDQSFVDDSASTWGLKATGVMQSPYSGEGTKVAVLDTGMAMNHPDFAGRQIITNSFITGQSVEDGNGHGTHCIGTACGPLSPTGTTRRYGVAYNSRIFAGKVLSNQGSGPMGSVLAGIEWAIQRECDIVSLSLSANTPTPLPQYEMIGQRALEQGTLLIAAAGNNANRTSGNRGFVSAPANSRSQMAVAAIDNRLRVANFSAGSIGVSGGDVDIAGPGVDVFSAWRSSSTRYRTISGTSMATPHVAGIAALFVESHRVKGQALWQTLTSHARRLSEPSSDVGTGLVQAPSKNAKY